MSRKKPEEVFTPRSAEVNPRMYITRPDLEDKLVRALRGTQHILIHGASGTGKSWLYKRTLSEFGACYEEVNLANAGRFGSISEAFRNVVERLGKARKTGYTEKKGAELNIVVAKGALEHAGNYTIAAKEPLEACLELTRNHAGDKLACLVLDNLEAVFSNEAFMDELGNIITLLDDRTYSQYDVKLLVVGIPSSIKEYFARVKNRQAVANRLRELPEVARLNGTQVMALVNQGFAEELQYAIDDEVLKKVAEHVTWVTDGVPQRVHEYCLELAYFAEENEHTVATHLLDDADRCWLDVGLADAYEAIESAMNDRETKVGRQNQTLFALGRIKEESFRSPEVEEVIIAEFPNSTGTRKLNVSGILSDLSKRDPPIVKRTPKGNSYVFSDPRYRMCIRAMLRKEGDAVYKLEFTGT